MPRKSISGFAEAGAAMAQQLDDNDLLNLFSAVGRVVSKRFLMKRPCLNSWQLVLDYLKSAMAFEPREQFRVLYLDKRNNLIADEVLAEGTVDHTPVYPREMLRRAIELHATGCVLVHNHPSGDATPSRADIDMTKQVVEVSITWHRRPRPCDYQPGWPFQPARPWPDVRSRSSGHEHQDLGAGHGSGR